MPFYEYHCPAGHVFERRARYEDAVAACACGEAAHRAEINLTAIVGETVMRPTKYRVSEMLEASAEVDYAYSKVEKETGEEVKRPNLWKQAKQEARRRGAKVR